MKKFLPLLFPCLLLCAPALAATHWYSEGTKSSPASGTLLADTGATTGNYSCFLIADSSVEASLVFQHRNAANDTTLHAQTFTAVVGTIFTPKFEVPYLDINERFRVLTDALAIGAIQTTLICVN